jgi:two-component system response regulator HydG
MSGAATTAMLDLVPRASAVWNLLVVDDERAIREGCREAAQAVGFNAFVADSAEHAYRLLELHNIDVVLLDLRLPGANGLEALRHIKARRPETSVIIITGFATIHSAVQAMKLGAYEYLTKPFSPEDLKTVLQHLSEELKSTAEQRLLREKLHAKQSDSGLVGRSPEMEKLYRIIAKAAQSAHPVLIFGESGTGKELVARSIHFAGPFRDKPFMPLDCGSLLPSVIESELFGYVRGAFPGAQRAKDGLLALPEGGTIFLDEVGELSLELQGKLLRAIQDREILPMGSGKRLPVNVRILAATNRDLEQAVSEGRFRRDLFFRLNVLTLRIPPLRERKQDISLLAQNILDRLGRNTGTQHVLSEEVLKAMLVYDWPGNIRELENCLERACTMSAGPVLRTADLSTSVQDAMIETPRGVPAGLRIMPLADMEKHAILSTIDRLNGDKLLAARLLGIGKTTLYRKLKEYGRD